MKSIVGVYETHEKAVDAINELKKAGYDTKQVSLLAKADLVNDHLSVKLSDTVEKAEVSVGAIAGAVLGVLAGISVFAIPGFGFLMGAGAVVGGFAGLDIGLMGGGALAILTSVGVDAAVANGYEKHLNEGKFIVLVHGSKDQLAAAHKTLHTSGLHVELTAH